MSTRKINFITALALLLLSAVTACQTTLPAFSESVPNPVGNTAEQDDLDTANPLSEPQQPVQVSTLPAQDNVIENGSVPEPGQFSPEEDSPNQDDDDDDEGSLLENQQHPVVNALVEEFNVDYEEIVALHQAGYGFGEIARAYALADELGMPPQEILPQAHKMGWGELLKAHGLHPSMAGKDNNLGAIMSEQMGRDNRPAHAGPPGGDGPPGLLKKGN